MIFIRLLLLFSLASCDLPPRTDYTPDSGLGTDVRTSDPCLVPMMPHDGYSEVIFAVSQMASFRTACVFPDPLAVRSLSLAILRPLETTVLAVKTGAGDLCISPEDSAFDDIVFVDASVYSVRVIGERTTFFAAFSGDVCSVIAIYDQ